MCFGGCACFAIWDDDDDDFHNDDGDGHFTMIWSTTTARLRPSICSPRKAKRIDRVTSSPARNRKRSHHPGPAADRRIMHRPLLIPLNTGMTSSRMSAPGDDLAAGIKYWSRNRVAGFYSAIWRTNRQHPRQYAWAQTVPEIFWMRF